MNYVEIIRDLRTRGVVFSKGLNEQEIIEIERYYEISFPPDLKELISIALPMSNGFVNWRDSQQENVKSIKDRLNWPLQGLIFDILTSKSQS